MPSARERRLAALEALPQAPPPADLSDVTAELAGLTDDEVLTEAIGLWYAGAIWFKGGALTAFGDPATPGGAWNQGIAARLAELRIHTGIVFLPLWREDALEALALIERGELVYNTAARGLIPHGLWTSPRWNEVFEAGTKINRAQAAVAQQTGADPFTDAAEIAAWLNELLEHSHEEE